MKTLVIAALLVLAGCATAPQSETGQSLEQFVTSLSGKELRLSLPAASSNAGSDDSILSAARDPVYGYAGLKQVYAPAYKHCEAGGGTLLVAERQSFSKAAPALPTRFQCRSPDKFLWALGVQYLVKPGADDKSRHTVLLTPQASLTSEAEEDSRRIPRSAPSKAETRTKEKEKVAHKAGSANKSPVEPMAKMNASATLKNFRKNLKTGDRVQWKAGDKPVRSVGTIVRLDGDLALVQFDNPGSAGQSVRYFDRSRLEPFDGLAR